MIGLLQMVFNTKRICQEVYAVAHNDRRIHTEYVAENDEDETREQPPPVFPKVGVELCEIFHQGAKVQPSLEFKVPGNAGQNGEQTNLIGLHLNGTLLYLTFSTEVYEVWVHAVVKVVHREIPIAFEFGFSNRFTGVLCFPFL